MYYVLILINAFKKNRFSLFAGIIDKSPLWKLYHLYGFDIFNDLVFDVMHCLSLNIFKKYIEEVLQKFGVTTVQKDNN